MFYRIVNDENALGLVLGKNKSESAASKAAAKEARTQHYKEVMVLWSDSLLIEGEHYPELVHQEEADKYEQQAISLLIDVLDAEKSGDDKAIKQAAHLVSIYGWTSEDMNYHA